MPSLTMLTGKHAGRVVPIAANLQVLIGRNDDCMVRLRTDLVSRHHCVVEYLEPDWVVRDLGSSNGTFVNGVRAIGPATIKNGDRLSIGPIHFQFAVEQAAPVVEDEDSDPDSGVINAWLADEGGSPVKKTTVLTDEQRAMLDGLRAEKKPPATAPPATGAVSDEALKALRKMNRGG